MPIESDDNRLVGTPALSIENLSFDYGSRRVLSEVSLSVASGETVILLGPNGAGKTTLFSLICGLFFPRQGKIEIGGLDLVGAGAKTLSSLGIVFQSQALDVDLTVRQNLRYFCALHGMSRQKADERIAEELERMAMAERIGEKVRGLNGGHRRRVEIARARLHRPRLLLLDEPTVGLDIPTRKALLADLHRESDGAALLWATHLIDEVEENDRVIILSQGRIVADGKPADIMRTVDAVSLAEAFGFLTQKKAGVAV